jgi:hypothetical protein
MNDQVYHPLSLEFHRARLGAMRAAVDDLIRSRPTSRLASGDILVRPRIRARIDRGIKAVPIYQIAAGAPRHDDFNRLVAPSERSWHTRASGDQRGRTEDAQAPIMLYQLESIYIVKDGNRRVAEARARGQMFLLAHVTECLVDPPLEDASDAITQLLLEEYHEFQAATDLAQLRPAQPIECTALGGYAELLSHIAAHRADLAAALNASVDRHAAAMSWYDTIYSPAVSTIRRLGLLEYFPGRTTTDIYLWAVDQSRRLSVQSVFPSEQSLPRLDAILRAIADMHTP